MEMGTHFDFSLVGFQGIFGFYTLRKFIVD
jgi:hypothetical protein